MRNRHALAETGGAELFAGEEAVKNGGAGQTEARFEKNSCLFEDAFLAAGFQVQLHLVGAQEIASEGS